MAARRRWARTSAIFPHPVRSTQFPPCQGVYRTELLLEVVVSWSVMLDDICRPMLGIQETHSTEQILIVNRVYRRDACGNAVWEVPTMLNPTSIMAAHF